MGIPGLSVSLQVWPLPPSQPVAALHAWLKHHHVGDPPTLAPVTTCVCCPEYYELTCALSPALGWVPGIPRGQGCPGPSRGQIQTWCIKHATRNREETIRVLRAQTEF